MTKSYYLHTKELMDATDNGDASVVLYSDYELECTARIEAEKKLEELLSYIPKVPTQPHEKEMAMRIKVLEARLEKCKEQRNKITMFVPQFNDDIFVGNSLPFRYDQELEKITEEGLK